MKRMLLIWGLMAGLLAGACTVLEDRSVCPCYLTVDLTKVDKGVREWQMWLFTPEGELLYKDTVYRRSYSAPYIIQVPRNKKVQCLMWGNARSGTLVEETFSPATSLIKKEDVLADSLYFFADTISTWGEDSRMKVVPRKEFATVDIYMQGWADVEYEVRMVMVCGSKGFYVTGDFYPGEVSTEMELFSLGDYYTQFRGRILRQSDTENILLSLKIRRRKMDGTLGEELVNKDIPIGKYLEENGYNIQNADLGDIRMEVDYSYTNLKIKAEDWEATYKIAEEI